MLRRLWARWKALAYTLGHFQSKVLLNLFYALILAPFGLAVRLFSDPLRLRRTEQPHWLPRPKDVPASLEAGRRQF
jgi:hypothetical protein